MVSSRPTASVRTATTTRRSRTSVSRTSSDPRPRGGDPPPRGATLHGRRPMIRARILVLAALLVASASYALGRPSATDPIPPGFEGRISSSAVAEPVGRAERAEVERLIRAFEARIRDHTDPIDYKFLGRLHLDRARATGDVSSY